MRIRIAFFLLAMLSASWGAIPLQSEPRPEYPRTPWGGYPFAASYDAEIAAPNVHRVLYEDEHIMFLEVANPPGLDVRMHGHPYPSVFARDTGSGPATRSGPAGAAGVPIDDTHLDPDSIFAGQGWGEGGPPAGLEFPRCTTAPPEGRIGPSTMARRRSISIASSFAGSMPAASPVTGASGTRGC